MITFRYGDLFKVYRKPDGPWTIITTNGFVKKNGEAVMGRGIARQAARAYPELPKQLGQHLQANGNIPAYLRDGLASLPVKHEWWQAADPQLIRDSTIYLAEELQPPKLVRFPRPGCGNGQLEWDEVKEWWLPLVHSLFADVEVWHWTKDK